MKSLKANFGQTEASPQLARGGNRISARPQDFGSNTERHRAVFSHDPTDLWARAGEVTAGEPLPTSRWCLDDYAAGEGVVASQLERPNPATHPVGSIHYQPLPTSRWGFDE
jgi:hypothetical protein